VRAATGDAGGIVIGWLTKLIVSLAVFAVIVFDGLAVGVGALHATDDANSAADAASAAYHSDPNVQLAYEAAETWATQHGEQALTSGFQVDPDGRVHLTLIKHVTTLLLYRIGPLAHYTFVRGRGDALDVTA